MNMLKDPGVFSMTNLRGVVDRLVSGFFYSKPHSPLCAREDVVVRREEEEREGAEEERERAGKRDGEGGGKH